METITLPVAQFSALIDKAIRNVFLEPSTQALISQEAQKLCRPCIMPIETTLIKPVKETVSEQLLTCEEAMFRLRISRPTLGKHMREGRIKFHRLGKRVLFKSADVDAALSPSRTIKEYEVSRAKTAKRISNQ